jgi:hypothetical protein
MKSIADALVYAVSYINCRDAEDDDLADDDIDAMEAITAYLSDATSAEQDALATAAKKALQEELSLNDPRQELIDDFSRWMEYRFSENWVGNDRT